MAFICTRHPSSPAVDVCDRCGTTMCDSCAVLTARHRVVCHACALELAGVHHRAAPHRASRRSVAQRRRALRTADDRNSAGQVAAERDRAADEQVAAWWQDHDDLGAHPEGWTRRF